MTLNTTQMQMVTLNRSQTKINMQQAPNDYTHWGLVKFTRDSDINTCKTLIQFTIKFNKKQAFCIFNLILNIQYYISIFRYENVQKFRYINKTI